jgi:hypothetical protein
MKANEDQSVINLEHIMPRTPSAKWNVDAEVAAACENRLGNLLLLRAKTNVAIGNASFEEKREVYKESVYAISQRVAEYENWGLSEINEHQAWLAEAAIKAWPVS